MLRPGFGSFCGAAAALARHAAAASDVAAGLGQFGQLEAYARVAAPVGLGDCALLGHSQGDGGHVAAAGRSS